MTNFEKLRSMSKEELADKMVAAADDYSVYCNLKYCPDEQNDPDKNPCPRAFDDVTACRRAALRWLNSETVVEPRKFVKKPVVVEAVQLSWQTWSEVYAFIDDKKYFGSGVFLDDNTLVELPEGKTSNTMGLIINTLEGSHLARQGDYIIKGVQGEFYPCKQDIFEQTYKEVTESEAEHD